MSVPLFQLYNDFCRIRKRVRHFGLRCRGMNPLVAAAALAITHVTVIDVERGARLADRTVLIQDGKIASVDAAPPQGVPVLDGTGKFVIPGLWDMHAHPNYAGGRDEDADRNGRRVFLPLYLANGVTGLRIMAGDCDAPAGAPCEGKNRFDGLKAWQREIAAGTLPGPARMVIATVWVDGPHPHWAGSISVKSPAEARAVVRRAKERGFDLIKVYNGLSPESFHALAGEARKLGMPIGGHVPRLVSAAEASEAGMVSEEHLFGLQEGCAKDTAALYAARRKVADDRKALSALMNQQRASLPYDGPGCKALFETFRRNGTFIVPTYSFLRSDSSASYADPPRRQDDPALRYVPADVRKQWQEFLDKNAPQVTPQDLVTDRAVFHEQLAVARRLSDAGVGLLAGSDGDNPFVIPGFSLQDELRLMVEGGLTPLQALQTATLNPARYLRQVDRFGTVAPGRAADLLVLDADPLERIENTARIHAVIAGGRLYRRADLDALLLRAEESMGTP